VRICQLILIRLQVRFLLCHGCLNGVIRWLDGCQNQFVQVDPLRAYQSLNPDDLKRLATHIQKSLSAKGLSNSVQLLKGQPGVQVFANQLDTDDMLLGVMGGMVVNLKTGIARPQTASDLITKSAGCVFDPDATCPLFENFLQSIFRGDVDLIDYIQTWLGYALTGLTREQQLLFGYGIGANGKSVLFSILQALMGAYAIAAPVDTIMMRGKEGPKSHLLARLEGARLVIANETADNQALAENLIKEMTGGEKMAADAKYKDVVEFQPKFKLVVVGNHKPVIRGTDSGIWRRLHMVPFDRVLSEVEQDRDLLGKLKAELPGILNWAIKGCLNWQRTGLLMPDVMRRSVEEYRNESDVIGLWLDEKCETAPALFVAASTLFMSYKNWCEANGHFASSTTLLGKRLADRGFSKRKSGTVTWRGLALRQGMLPGM